MANIFRRFPSDDFSDDFADEILIQDDTDEGVYFIGDRRGRFVHLIANEFWETPAGGAQEIIGAGGIAGAEAFGSLALSVTIASAGVATSEAFGGGVVSAVVVATGIATGEAHGSPSVALTVNPAGIVSGAAYGAPTLTVDITGAGAIPTSEAFGLPTVVFVVPPQEVTGVGGIASAEAFGQPSLAWIHDIVGAGGITSGEAFGDVALSVAIYPLSIVTGEAFGLPTVELIYLIAGVTRDSGGAPLGSCVIQLFRTSDDAIIEEKTSAGDGSFSFTVPNGITQYYIVAYKAGSPDVAGTTVNTLVGT